MSKPIPELVLPKLLIAVMQIVCFAKVALCCPGLTSASPGPGVVIAHAAVALMGFGGLVSHSASLQLVTVAVVGLIGRGSLYISNSWLGLAGAQINESEAIAWGECFLLACVAANLSAIANNGGLADETMQQHNP